MIKLVQTLLSFCQLFLLALLFLATPPFAILFACYLYVISFLAALWKLSFESAVIVICAICYHCFALTNGVIDFNNIIGVITINYHHLLQKSTLALWVEVLTSWLKLTSLANLLPLFLGVAVIGLIRSVLSLGNQIVTKKGGKQEITPEVGVYLGNYLQQNVVLSDRELNQHALIIGTTGSGKTTTILNFVASAAKRNLPVVYLDGKGSLDLVDNLSTLASHYGRKFKVFCLRPQVDLANLAGYNPLHSGSATEWKNRIMALFAEVSGRGQEHFSLKEQNYLNFVALILSRLDKTVDLRVLLAFLEEPEKLLKVAHQIEPAIARKLAALQVESGNMRELAGDVAKLLELFIYSDYGHLLCTIGMENVINLRQSILNNEIVLFLFDAATYPEDTKKLAKIVINDLNSSFASFSSPTKAFCIFDEFASYASDNLADTISLQRSQGMHAIIGTQSIATVKLKNNDTKRIAEELIACCNTYIIQKINHHQDALMFADILGTDKVVDITMHKDQEDRISQTLRNIEHYKVTPNELKELITGEAVIYRKVLKTPPFKMKIEPDVL